MAGNKATFEAAIKRGDSSAWAGRWEDAIAEFSLAVRETPDSVLAHRSLGLAFARSHRYAEALTEFEAVLAQLPDDLLVQGRVADMRGELGRLDQFAESQMGIAEAFLRQRNYRRATATWRHILAVVPGYDEARIRLAEALDRGGFVEEAAVEYRDLALHAKAAGALDKAGEWARRAREADPLNADVEALYRSLQGFAPSTAGSSAPSPTAASASLGDFLSVSTPSGLPEPLAEARPGAPEASPRPAATTPDLRARLNQAMEISAEYLAKRLFAAAVEECLASIEADPSFLPAQIRLAEIYGQMSRVDDAVVKYDTLAAVYLVRGEPEESASMYRRLLALAPRSHDVRRRLAQLLVDLGRTDDAVEQYFASMDADLADRGLALSPRELDTVWEGAANYLSSAGRRPPESATLWMALGRVAHRQGAVDTALAAFERAQKTGNADDPAVLTNLGELYIEKQRWDEALGAFRQLKNLSPGDETPYVKCAEVLFRSGQPAASLAEFDSLVELQLAAGDLPRAKSTAEIMRRLAPQSAVPRLRLSQIHAARGATEDAIQELFALAHLKTQQGALKDAEVVYRRIALLDPRRKTAWVELGDLLTRGGRIEEARQAFAKALALAPDDEQVRRRVASAGGSVAS